MAGDWMQIDLDLPDKAEVKLLKSKTGLGTEAVVGRLVSFWRWVHQNAVDGVVKHIDAAVVADVVNAGQDFVDTLCKVGWLKLTDAGAEIPGWEDRFSKAAKQRIVDAKRKKSGRASEKRPPTTGRKSDAPRTKVGSKEEGELEKSNLDSSKEESCSEVGKPPREPERTPFDFPVVGKGPDSWNLPKHELDEYKSSYPDLDVEGELRKARQWLQSNKRRRKSANGMLRFLTSWMNRATDKKPPPERPLFNGQPPERDLTIPRR
jgi:hypothetical protein